MNRVLRQRDEGFTLVELLVAITVMVLLTGTLGFTLVSVLRNVGAAQDRVQRSMDTTIVGLVFPKDINHATSISLSGSAPCGTGTPLFTLKTTNVRLTPNPSNQIVWYSVNAKGALVRYECGTGGVVVNTTQLADSVSSPLVTCEMRMTTSPYFATLPNCLPQASVGRVVLNLTFKPVGGGAAADAPRNFTLYAKMSSS